jgi:DNA-binding NarL/FixJ family response regulator
MTVREIARALHLSPGRVKQLEHRALEKLRANPGLLFQYALELFEPGDSPEERAR